VALLFGSLLFSSNSVFAEDDGSVLRTLIPVVAYGTTFYSLANDGFYGIAVSKHW
jgi:hypothetical protein